MRYNRKSSRRKRGGNHFMRAHSRMTLGHLVSRGGIRF